MGERGARERRCVAEEEGGRRRRLRLTWKSTMPEKTTAAFLAMASSLSMTTLVRWMTIKELVLTRKPATVCDGGCNRMRWRLQPYAMGAATVCDGGGSRM